MATQLFLLDSVADTHLGTDNTNVLGTAVGWTSKALGASRGSGVIASDNVATVTGATTGITITKTSPVEWISPPVSADVTISGTITGNIWASESNMSANVAINVIIDIIRADATATRNSNTIVQIVKSTFATEVAVTTRAANNFTSGMTSGYSAQTLNRGDRLRVRVFGDDAGVMATGFTFNASWNGTSAAADGDSYVTLTETVAFESPPGALMQTIQDGFSPVGAASVSQQAAQAFAATTDTLTEVRVWLRKTGSPTDDVVLEIQTDSSGSPSGSVVGTVATVTAASLTGTAAEYTYSTSLALTPSSTYWLVARRSGALSDSNLYAISGATNPVSGWTVGKTYTGSWGALATFDAMTVRLTFSTSTLYLTNTASDVSTASIDREAWTSRGSGVVSDTTTCFPAGWTAPRQLVHTAGAGATDVVDWFTKQLTAFTLTGMAVANLRTLQNSTNSNATLRCEIARVDSDGTNPTVWASWCIAPTGTDNGELSTSEVARTANVSGDDLAVSDGQRLRIRIYIDDMSSAAMGATGAVNFYYAGTSAAASGDTYITLPQTVTEYASFNTYTKAGYGKESG